MRSIGRGATVRPLFSDGSLRDWLEERRSRAVQEVRDVDPDEALRRPPDQLVDEIANRYLVPVPSLDTDSITGGVDDQRVDVSGDFRRGFPDGPGPFYIDGSRIALRAPYSGPAEVLKLRPRTSSLSPPRAAIGDRHVEVHRDVPADSLERDREQVQGSLRADLDRIAKAIATSAEEVAAWNERLRTDIRGAVEARRKKVLVDRDTEAMLGVPLHRDQDVAKTYRVQPVARKRTVPQPRRQAQAPYKPEPAIDESGFASLVEDIVVITRSFERLAVTYADIDEERLRDQILAMLGNVYGPPTGESFSKRGKSDIYLPWDGGHPVFLAECKWWTGPKAFAERDLPQLLDRYVVWRDTHAAMVLFISNRNATQVIANAEAIIRQHERYIRDDEPIGDVPVFVLHKEGDPDREIKLALIAAVIRR